MLIDQIRADLTAAMKARDSETVSVLRMAVAAVKEVKVSGDQARELTDDDVMAVLTKEANRREEAAAAFAEGGREEQAAKELAEKEILARYLPAPLTDEELGALVDEVLASEGISEASQMGPAMKAVTAKVAGRRDGRAVSAMVRSRLNQGSGSDR